MILTEAWDRYGDPSCAGLVSEPRCSTLLFELAAIVEQILCPCTSPRCTRTCTRTCTGGRVPHQASVPVHCPAAS